MTIISAFLQPKSFVQYNVFWVSAISTFTNENVWSWSLKMSPLSMHIIYKSQTSKESFEVNVYKNVISICIGFVIYMTANG